MADIVSTAQKLNDIEVSSDGPVSEALMSKIGANINYMIDHVGAIEARKDGAVFTGSSSGSGSSFTIVQLPVTLNPNDTVECTIGANSTNLSGAGAFNASVGGSGGSFTLSIQLVRSGSVIASKSVSGAAPLGLSVPSTPIYDQPGSGGFTYAVVVSCSSSVNLSWTGYASLRVIRG